MPNEAARQKWIEAVGDGSVSLDLAPAHYGFFRTRRALRFPWRHLEHDLLYLVLERELTISSGGGDLLHALPGTLVYLPAGYGHEVRVAAGAAFQHLRFRLWRGPQPLALHATQVVDRNGGAALTAFQRIEAIRRAGSQPYAIAAVRAWLTLLFIEGFPDQQAGDPAVRRPPGGLDPGIVSQSVLFIARNLDRDPAVGELARHVGLSHDYYARRFRQSFGVSPRQYIAQQKLLRAGELLATTQLRVQEVADELGFQSLSSFTERFRRYHGLTPSAYRERQASALRPVSRAGAASRGRSTRWPQRAG